MKVSTPKGEQLSGESNYLKTPGTYHFLVTNVNVGVGPKGTAIDGSTFECKVLAGLPDKGHAGEFVGKDCSITLFAPNMTSSEKAQGMTHRQNTAFFLATNCLQPADLGKEDLEINEELANGAQFVCRMATGQKQNDKGEYVDSADAPLRVHFSDIWHVDDPAVAKIPKQADAIALIEGKDRHKPEWFDFKKGKGAAGRSNPPATDYDDPMAGIV